MKKTFVSIIFLLGSIVIYGYELNSGTPTIVNYSSKDYGELISNNNFYIDQDERGFMYFANEFGILEFDGNNWSILVNATNLSNFRSLAIDKTNRIYAGAQGDFGYIGCNDAEQLTFTSLQTKIPKGHEYFGDVWNIILDDDRIIFHTWKGLYIYKNDEIRVLQTGRRIIGVYQINNRILVQDEEAFYELGSNKLIRIKGGEGFSGIEVRFMLPFDGNAILLGTYSNGLYLWKDGLIIPYFTSPKFNFSQNRIVTAQLRKNGDIVIGTQNSGIFILSSTGELVNHISTSDGLLNNSIRALFSDGSDNLWVAHKKGIDHIELSSRLSRILLDSEDPVGVYASKYYNNSWYFATHSGLLVTDNKQLNEVVSAEIKLKKVQETPDIVWNLNRIDDILLVSHEQGITQISKNEVTPLYEEDGAWLVKPIPDHPDKLIAGTYTGLVLLKKGIDGYSFDRKIKGFDESSRLIELDHQSSIWVAHGYKGIYRIKLSDDLSTIDSISFYDTRKGLPSDFLNNVFKIWGEIVIGTQNGFYKYDALTDSMVLHKELSELLGVEHGRLLKEDKDGNVWFVIGNKSGILKRFANGRFEIQDSEFAKLYKFYIPGFENFELLENESALICSKNGVIHFNNNLPFIQQNKLDLILRRVERAKDGHVLFDDQLEKLCETPLQKQPVLPFTDNSIKFSFATGFYEDIGDVRYKYFLQGLDKDWSEWKPEAFKEYTNLREGEYIFRVKAKNVYNTESDEVFYPFTITPPIYRSKSAYVFYLFSVMATFFLFIRIRDRKLRIEKGRYIKEQENLRSLEQAHYKEEKLRNELVIKDKELSGFAMSVIYKNEKLTELKERVSTIKRLASEKVSLKMMDLLAFIENELEDDNWDDFELRFDQTHNNFIKNLKDEYPQLTSKDLKICAYLRMNLSSKEIAKLLNMTVRGVENARYRVRKRIDLDASINLTEWLLLRK